MIASPGVLNNDTEEEVTNGSWRDQNLFNNTFFSLEGNFGHNYNVASKEICEEFKNYFVSSNGEVP